MCIDTNKRTAGPVSAKARTQSYPYLSSLETKTKISTTQNFASINFCNIHFHEFEKKLHKFVLQKRLPCYVISKLLSQKFQKCINLVTF